MAVIVGFVLLSALLTAAFPTAESHLLQPNRASAAPSDAQVMAEVLTARPAQKLAARNAELAEAVAAQSTRLDNAERVGLDLFEGHPLGIELAGIILLVGLVGAVVIAKTRVEPAEPAPEMSQ